MLNELPIIALPREFIVIRELPDDEYGKDRFPERYKNGSGNVEGYTTRTGRLKNRACRYPE